MESTWTGLLVLCGVAVVGLLLAKTLARWNLPEVLAYLLVGIILGPQVLGVLSPHLLERMAFVPQLLLGFVAFMLGELLTPRALLARRTLPITTAVLAVALPFVAVVGGCLTFTQTPVRAAVTLGVLAMAGAPATILVMRQSLGDHSAFGDLLATLAAIDNLIVVILYGTLAPFLVASVAEAWSLPSALGEVLVTVAGGLALGLVGAVLLWLLRVDEEDNLGHSVAGAVLVIAILVASALLLGASPLIACAVAGIGTAVREQRIPHGVRSFDALRGLEGVVYVFFFVFAGTEIVFGNLFAAGLLALVYIVGRAGGKILAGVVGGLFSRRSLRDAFLFGSALIPQAGVVVGLALDASIRFPYLGSELLAVVMAALVVFEIVGPFAVQSALRGRTGGSVDAARP